MNLRDIFSDTRAGDEWGFIKQKKTGKEKERKKKELFQK